MSFNSILDVSASSMSAQQVRLNAISSNLANADVVAGTEEGAYKPLRPVFASVHAQNSVSKTAVAVQVADVVEVQGTVTQRYEPNNPLANEDGLVFVSGVNVVDEMADMMAAKRGFEASVEVMGSAKKMQQQLLALWDL
ncbi:flagellar basal body rod protein FlgC [Vibrio breoganii]